MSSPDTQAGAPLSLQTEGSMWISHPTEDAYPQESARTREMAQSPKSLPHKHEDLGSIPGTYAKMLNKVGYTSIPSPE